MEPTPLSVLAVRIRTLRQKAGLSQEALAARAHISIRSVARLESPDNHKAPLRSTVVLIAAALDVHPDRLIFDNGDEAAA